MTAMAIFGFVVIVLLSLAAIGAGLFLLWIGLGFGHGIGDNLIALFLVALGATGLYYFAWLHSPLRIIAVGAA